MLLRRFFLLVPVLFLSAAATAQAQGGDNDAPAKRATIVRVADGAIRVDGRLDEEVWARASPSRTSFRRNPPKVRRRPI